MPSDDYQLVTCHAVCWSGFSFPFVFALLPDKKSATYSTLFTTIDSIARQKFNVNVFSRTGLTVLCDFERGLLKALSLLDCFVKCCHFHQTQAIWRFVAKRGLSGQYITNDSFRSNVRSLMVLPFFPEASIRELYRSSRSRNAQK